MAVIALVSAKSVGVSVSALALTLEWPREVLLADCDPAGGSLRLGWLQSQVDASVGLHQLARAERENSQPEEFERHLVALEADRSRLVLPGLTEPAQVGAMSRTWGPLADVLATMERIGYDVIVDGGRVVVEAGQLSDARSPAPLLRRADVVLLVVRSSLVSVGAAAGVAGLLKDDLRQRGTGADALGVLLIEDGPYRSHEVASSLQLPVVAGLRRDDEAARALEHGGRSHAQVKRSQLLRGAASAAGPITELISRRRLRLAAPAPLSRVSHLFAGQAPTHQAPAPAPMPAAAWPPPPAQPPQRAPDGTSTAPRYGRVLPSSQGVNGREHHG